MDEVQDEFEPTPEFHITVRRFFFHLLRIWPGILWLRRKAWKKAKKLEVLSVSLQIPTSREIFEHLKKVCEPPHRRIGTPEAHKIEDYLVNTFKTAGLEQVTKQKVKITLWQATNWKLLVTIGEKTQEIPSFYVLNTGFTDTKGITAPLIYVGKGRPKDFKKKNVKGKIVVGDIDFPILPYGALAKLFGYYISDPTNIITRKSKGVMTFARMNFPHQSLGGEPRIKESIYWQAVEHGAVGIILILKGHPTNTNTHWGPYDGVMKPIPGLYVGNYDGEELRELVQSGEASGTIILEGNQSPAVAHNIYGILPGQSEEMILVSTHHDSAFKGASEDGTGVAMVLAQLEAWSKIPRSARPRSLLFLITAGHLYAGIGAETFARSHRKDLLKRVLVDVNLEHLCAKHAIDDPTTHEFLITDDLAPGVIFVSRKELLLAAVIKMCQDHSIENLFVIPDNFFGTMPIGEAGHLMAQGKLNVIHWIRSPYYLLTAEDTLDKVAIEKLSPTAKAVADLLKILMVLPKERF